MQFEIKKRDRKQELYYPTEEFNIARDFAQRLYKEFGDFIKALILFGSTTTKPKLEKERDIDILVILDDVSVNLSDELTQTYRIVTEKILFHMPNSERLHVQSMRFTSFWEYIRAGDPVAINVLRYGVSLIDTGIFDPLQSLLDNGRIRPTLESVYTYFTMAPASVHRSKEHILSAMIDLYWASIDAAHAAVMAAGYIPPTPEHASDLLEEALVKKGYLKKRYAEIMRKNYKIFKQIVHREVKEVNGRDYDRYKKDTIDFVNAIKKYLETKAKL